MVKNRKYGLDLLRIIAMLGVVILHIVGHGEALTLVAEGSAKYWMLWFIQICSYCSVDVFAMLTGYLCCKKDNFNSYRLFEILTIVFLYSILGTVLIYFIKPEFLNSTYNFINSLIPGLCDGYWYVTAYIPLLITLPFVNRAINLKDIKKIAVLVFSLLALFTVIPSFLRIDLFGINDGYSFLWILICYLLGAYLNKFEYKRIKNIYYVIIYFASSLVLLLGNIFIYTIKAENIKYLISYISPFIILMAVCVFRLFENIKLEKCNAVVKKLIVIFSSVAFDIYIIHTHPMIFRLLFKGNFGFISKLNIIFIPIAIILSALIIYIVFAMVGYIRIKLFKAIKLPQLFSKLTKDKLSYSLDK